ncbi:MAG: hypothetical protein HFJ17_00500 [Clostridia bacterium]|nr:hypothetical protein [Clostridia bacterium]
MTKYNEEEFSNRLVEYAINNSKRFIYISGNGGAGKSTFSKFLKQSAEKYGKVNLIHMDEFVVDTNLRNNTLLPYKDQNGNLKKGRCTTSFKEAYFIQNVNAIIYNLKNGNNYYHYPKNATTDKECELLYSDAIITIIEGVGTVFINQDKNDSINVFMECNEELEILRRMQRTNQTREEVLETFEERNIQFKQNVLPYREEYDMIIESNSDYSITVKKNKLNI